MYQLCFVFVTCCAFYPRAFAAPTSLAADSRSQLESNAEQQDRLQEESILSKVGGHKAASFTSLYTMSLMDISTFIEIQTFLIEHGGNYIRPLLFVAAG